MTKTLYLLLGPKGAGKTYIGNLVDEQTDINFIRVEPIWLALRPGEDGWQSVETAVDTAFQTQDKVMIESLGAGEGFHRLHNSLAQKYAVKYIRVFADLTTCLARVKNRDSASHLPVSDEQVAAYNKIAANVVYDWDLEIDNSSFAEDATIVRAILSV